MGSRHGTSELCSSFVAILLALALAGRKVAADILGITYSHNKVQTKKRRETDCLFLMALYYELGNFPGAAPTDSLMAHWPVLGYMPLLSHPMAREDGHRFY